MFFLIKVHRVNLDVILSSKSTQKHGSQAEILQRLGCFCRVELQPGNMECEDEAEKLGTDKTPSDTNLKQVAMTSKITFNPHHIDWTSSFSPMRLKRLIDL